MLGRIAASRNLISFAVAADVWISAWFLHPFPLGNPLLELIHLERPAIYQAIRWAYIVMWFTTPWIATSIALSLAYIFMVRYEGRGRSGQLPPYSMPADRTRLSVIVGEVHHPKKPVSSAHPRWLTVPERGLYTGIAIVGAIGSGKTSCCVYPFAEQILAFCHGDPEKCISGLVLEVKGDFCHKVRQILQKYGRESDFIEMSLDSPYRYNPLHNDLETYALGYGIDAGVNLLSGKSAAHKATINTSKSYNVVRDVVFEPKLFAELKNAQAIVLAYDGLNPLPPAYCYLKPYYLDPNRTWFEQLANGEI